MRRHFVRTRRRIGLVVPFDLAQDREYWQYVDDDVSVHITRTDYHDGPTGLALVELVSDEEEVVRGTRSLIKIEPDVVGYACTSGSFIDGLRGERRLRTAILGAGAPKAVTTSGAFLEALAALGITRVGLGTPYVGSLAQRLESFVTEGGFQPVSLVNLEVAEGIWEVGDDKVVRLAEAAMRPGAEAVFISCTNLSAIDAIAPLEARLGVPVLTANQVTMWAALRAAGGQPNPRVLDQALFRRTAASVAA